MQNAAKYSCYTQVLNMRKLGTAHAHCYYFKKNFFFFVVISSAALARSGDNPEYH